MSYHLARPPRVSYLVVDAVLDTFGVIATITVIVLRAVTRRYVWLTKDHTTNG